MSQKMFGGKGNKQVGGDDNSNNVLIRNTIYLCNLIGIKEIFSPLIKLWKWIQDLRKKDEIIHRLGSDLKSKNAEISTLKSLHEANIKKLQEEFSRKLEQLVEASKSIQSTRDIIDELCSKAQALGDQSACSDLLELRRQLDRPLPNFQKRKPYMQASMWMKDQSKDKWIHEIVDSLYEECSTTLAPQDRESLCQDLHGYLDWIQESLFYAKPLRKDLEELNRRRSIPLDFPYQESLKRLNVKINHNLGTDVVSAFQKMVQYLHDHLE